MELPENSERILTCWFDRAECGSPTVLKKDSGG